MWWRKVGMGATLAATAVALSGCVVFPSEPTAAQKGVIGPVKVTVSACASNTSASPPTGSCPAQGNSAQDASTSLSQIWLGFRQAQHQDANPKGTSTTPVTVSVGVPSSAHPGNYRVRLTAKLPDGEFRRGTVVLTVR